MRRSAILLVISGTVLVVGAGVYGTSFSQQTADHKRMVDESKVAERSYIEQLVAHHEAAVSIASQAAEQAASPELKDLAATMAATSQSESTNMRSWYKQWYGGDVPKPATDPHAGHAPENGATTFEQSFVGIMIPHEEAGVKLSRDVQPKAAHQEIKDLAAAIIWRVPAEIQTMKKYQVSSSGVARTIDAPTTITYTGVGFSPSRITITTGTTIKFVNQRSDRPMWVASNDHPEHLIYPEFDQARFLGYEPLPKDTTYAFTFTKRGTWTYHDHYDAARVGTITVN